MSRIRQSPKLPPEVRRRQLLNSARKLFVKKGFRGTTTEEIARSAGLTKGALYHHFANKEEILLELVKTISDHSQSAIEQDLPAKLSPGDFLQFLLDLHCRWDRNEYGELVDIWVQAWRVPRTKRFITKRLREAAVDLSRHLDPAYGITGKAAEQFIMPIMALVDGLSVFNMLVPASIDLEAQVKLYRAAFDKKVRARGANAGCRTAIILANKEKV